MWIKSRHCSSCKTDIGREEYLPICDSCNEELTSTAKRICEEARKDADEQIAKMNAQLHTRKDPKPATFTEGFVVGFLACFFISLGVVSIFGAKYGQETKTEPVPRAEIFGPAEKDAR